MTPQRIAPQALYQEVAERLRQRIFAHELPPGRPIDELRLAAEYGISRTPLREALKVLAAEGLVTLIPRRGAFVSQISGEELDAIFDVLAVLEGHAARRAAERLDEASARQLRQLHERLEEAARAGRSTLSSRRTKLSMQKFCALPPTPSSRPRSRICARRFG